MVDLKEFDEILTQYVRPQTFPVAVRMCPPEEPLPGEARLPGRDMGLTISVCHAITMARRAGWTVAVDKTQSCFSAGLSMGFLPFLPDVADGSYQESIDLLDMSREQASAVVQSIPKLEYGKYDHMLIAPLGRADFEPNVVLIYANPAQVWIMLAGYLSAAGRTKLDVTLTPSMGCTRYITQAIQTDECQFAIVDGGERIIAHPHDHECVFSIPMSKMEMALKGIETRHRTREYARYPIPSFMQYSSQQPAGYDMMRKHLLGEDT